VTRLRQKNLILPALAISLLLLALFYQNIENKNGVLKTLQRAEPATASYETLPGNYPSYKLRDGQGNFLGYGVIASASGYGGKLTVLSIVDESGRIQNVSLLTSAETPIYLNRLLASGFLERFKGSRAGAELGELDAISGATVSADAIKTAVQKGIAQVGNDQLNMKIPVRSRLNLHWHDATSVILAASAFAAGAFGARKLRPWLLTASVLLMGFLSNHSIGYSNFLSLLAGNLPVFVERPAWYVLVPGILLVTLALGRNYYCNWLCPFGGVQEGIYRSLNLVKFSPSREIQVKVRKWRWPVLWAAAMIALLFKNPSISGYEPFSAFFDSSGTTAQWIILGLVVIMSMAQVRFWCRGFCPVGLILDTTARLRWTLKRSKKEQQAAPAPDCSSCAARRSVMNTQDRIFSMVATAVNILIIVTLFQNAGVL
jgi:uncharacterized protein with FMN-binding domain